MPICNLIWRLSLPCLCSIITKKSRKLGAKVLRIICGRKFSCFLERRENLEFEDNNNNQPHLSPLFSFLFSSSSAALRLRFYLFVSPNPIQHSTESENKVRTHFGSSSLPSLAFWNVYPGKRIDVMTDDRAFTFVKERKTGYLSFLRRLDCLTTSFLSMQSVS